MLDAWLASLGDRPAVSVVVPALDEERFLRPCLRSIREQWFQPWECVIIDDGSTDATATIAQEFVDKDPRFRLVRHESSRGLAAARNTGLAETAAPYVTFLDGDDFLYQHSLKSRLEAILEVTSDNVAGVYCDWQPTREKEGRTPPERAPADRGALLGFIHGPECPFIATAPLIRRDVLVEHGGFDESLPTAEDFDLWIRILRNGYTFRYVPRIGVAYRQNSSGMMFTGSALHATVAGRIIESQFDDLTDEPARPLFHRSIASYMMDAAVATRLLQSFALATAFGDEASRAELRSLLPSSVPLLARAGLDVSAVLRAGLARASRAAKELNDSAVRLAMVRAMLEELDLSID